MPPRVTRKPPRPQTKGTPFEAAHNAILNHYEKTKEKGYKERRQALVQGKKLMDGYLAMEAITKTEAQQWTTWIDEEVFPGEENEDTCIVRTAPSSLVVPYHYAALVLMKDKLLAPVAAKIEGSEKPSVSFRPSMGTEGAVGEAECVAAMIHSIIQSAKTIHPFPKEFHSDAWLDLLLKLLEALGGGHIGGTVTSASVSSLLETIVNDDSNKTGLKLLLKKKDNGLILGECLASSSSAILSFNLVQVIAAMTKGTKESDQLVRKIFEGRWSDEVTEEGIKLFKEIKAQGRSTPIVLMDLVNLIAGDEGIFLPRGFQVTTLLIDGENEITGDRPLRRLKDKAIIAYVDLWLLTVNNYDEDGELCPCTFAVERILGFNQVHAGAFLLDVKLKDEQRTQGRLSVSLSIETTQATGLEKCLKTLIGGGLAPAEMANDEYDEGFDALLSSADLAELEQAAKDLRSDGLVGRQPNIEAPIPEDVSREELNPGPETEDEVDEVVGSPPPASLEVVKDSHPSRSNHVPNPAPAEEDMVPEEETTPPSPRQPTPSKKGKGSFLPLALVGEKSSPKMKTRRTKTPDAEVAEDDEAWNSAAADIPDSPSVTPTPPRPVRGAAKKASESVRKIAEKEESPAPAASVEDPIDEDPVEAAPSEFDDDERC